MQSPSHAPDIKHAFQLKAVARPAQGMWYSSLEPHGQNLSKPAGKTQPWPFAQICLLSRAGNLNRCLQWAAVLLKTLCQNANKKPHCFPFLLTKCLQQSSTRVKNIGLFSDALVEDGSIFPLPVPNKTAPIPSPHSASPQMQTHHATTRGSTRGRHHCQQQRLSYLFHVMAQQLKVRQEFKHLLTRIWELWVLPQKWPFNPAMASLPSWEAAIKPLQQIAWDVSERRIW